MKDVDLHVNGFILAGTQMVDHGASARYCVEQIGYGSKSQKQVEQSGLNDVEKQRHLRRISIVMGNIKK